MRQIESRKKKKTWKEKTSKLCRKKKHCETKCPETELKGRKRQGKPGERNHENYTARTR